jgi:hypothetical protein
MYYKNPNPSVVRSSMHVCVLLFLPAVAFLLHAFLPKIAFLSDSACFQHKIICFRQGVDILRWRLLLGPSTLLICTKHIGRGAKANLESHLKAFIVVKDPSLHLVTCKKGPNPRQTQEETFQLSRVRLFVKCVHSPK